MQEELAMTKCIYKTVITLIAVLLAVTFFSSSVSAASYTYSISGNSVETPDAAVVETFVDSSYAGWGNMGLVDPKDLCAGPDGKIYIADTGNGRIVVLDKDLHFEGHIATPLLPDDSLGRLRLPEGVFVDENNELYIADTGNNQVLVCNTDGIVSRVITATAEDVYDDDFVFRPIKVAADAQGNVYVLSEGAYDGLMQFDKKGRFVGFVGANDVSVGVWEAFWKKFSTQIQRKQMVKSLPIEFDNLDIDRKGFVYTVTSSVNSINPTSGDPVRKQTALGINILKTNSVYGKPVGDTLFSYWDQSTIQGASKLTDISVQSYGYLCLDSNRGRVFAYSETAQPLFVLGGFGTELGKFTKPISMDAYGDRIFVLDNASSAVTVFRLTEYGSLILKAQQQYLDGEYDESEASWNKVLTYNSQLNIAYTGIGKVYYMQGEYSDALEYLKLGGDKATYSKAYGLYVQKLFSENIIFIVLALVFVAVIVVAMIFIFKRKPKKEKKPLPECIDGLKYAFYIMIHPFDGFWDMVHEKRGKKSSAAIIYVIWVFTWIINNGFTGFLFKELNSEFSLIKTISVAVLPIVLWCLCNWAVSTLLDGDGKPSHIIMATAYALVPYILCQLPCVLLTNLLTLDQGMLISILSAFGMIWTGILLVASVITVHNYTLKRSVGVIVLILCAMAIVVFLAVMIFNLVDQMRYFLVNIYKEIIINM